MAVTLRWVLVFMLLLPARAAWAHAAPVKLDPPNGAQVAPGPVTLRLGMNQPVELKFSRVSVLAADRSWNATLRLEGDRTVAADLPELSPGRYDVTWRVLSVDGHLTEGSYHFAVSPDAVQSVAAAGAVKPATSDPAVMVWGGGLGMALVSAVILGRRLRQSLRG